jgi:hypothetical protein
VAAASDPASALLTVEDQVLLSGHLLQHPWGLIGYLSARFHLTEASRALETVLVSADPTAEQAEQLRGFLRELDFRSSLEAALQMEMAMGLEVIDWSEVHSKAKVTGRGGRVAWKRGALWSGYHALNRSTYVREMTQLMGRCRRPWREIADYEEDLPRHNLAYLFTAMLLPGHSIASSRDEMLTRRQMMLVALDIEDFIAEYGRPPESLGELIEAQSIEAPDYAFDVFSGERLRYEPGEGGGYALWSIGRDLEDDGGVSYRDAEGDPDRESPDADVVFRVEPM